MDVGCEASIQKSSEEAYKRVPDGAWRFRHDYASVVIRVIRGKKASGEGSDAKFLPCALHAVDSDGPEVLHESLQSPTHTKAKCGHFVRAWPLLTG